MFIKRLSSYIAVDRRIALIRSEELVSKSAGTTLFVDISGYTKLTEAFVTEHGTLQGADRMTHWLNQVYDCLIEQIHRFGGSVVGFSGDAMTCWLDGDTGLRACAASVAMRRAIVLLSKECLKEENVGAIGIKVSLATGDGQRLCVGDPKYRLYDLLAGRILEHAAKGEGLAGRDEIVLHESTLEGVRPHVSVEEIQSKGEDRFYRLTKIKAEVESRRWDLSGVLTLDPERLAPWLLPPVFKKINAGQNDYLAELRRCVSLFLKFGGMKSEADGFLDEEAFNGFVQKVQEILAHFGGYLIQLTVGDKGSYLYAAFGAPLGHDDDPQRAVSAAKKLMAHLLKNPEIKPQIGIAQGLMRTGGYGGQSRRTYGVLGDAVNTAARLMAKAKSGQILISESLARVVSKRESVTEVDSLKLKGKEQAIKIFDLKLNRERQFRRVLPGNRGHHSQHYFQRGEGEPKDHSVMGREAERAAIRQHLHGEESKTRMVIVEGEAGIGKSTLIREIFEESGTGNFRVLFGGGDSVEVGTSFFPWRSIYAEILEPNMDDLTLRQRRKAIVGQLESKLRSRAPLLEGVLPLDWPDNAETSDLIGEARSDRTMDLLIELIRQQCEGKKLFIVLEDAHWIDSPSWQLIRRIYHQLHNTRFVLTSRPISGAIPLDFEFLRGRPESATISLSALTPTAICHLVCRNLGVNSIPDAISKLIIDKAEGHPFFSEEFAYALRDSGILSISNGECAIADMSLDLSTLDFPDTVQGIVTSRLDALSMNELLTLKVASVIGRNFSLGLVSDTHPNQITDKDILDHIRILVEKDLIRPVPGTESEQFQFKHAITQVAVYNMMLESQRQQIHKSAAVSIEEDHTEDLQSLYPLLAHHWCQTVDCVDAEAADLRKAIQYVALSAAKAKNLFANHEAVRFYTKAIELSEKLNESRSPLEFAGWHGELGQAYYEMGQLADSRVYLQEALRVLGYHWPRSRAGSLTQFAGQLCRQVFRKVKGVSIETDERKLRELKAGIRCYQTLGAISMLEAQALEAMHCAAAMLNLAERAGRCVESMSAFGFVCLMAGLVPAPKVAKNFNSKCLEAIEFLGSRPDDNGSAYLMLGLYHSSYGHWDEGRAILEYGCEHSQSIGSSRRWEECQGMLGMIDVCLGDYESGRERWQSIYESGTRRGDPQPQAWGTSGVIEMGLQAGLREGEAEELMSRAEQLLEESVNPADEIRLYGLLSRICWNAGMHKRAYEFAKSGLHKMSEAVPTLVYTFDGWTSLVAVLLWSLEEHKEGLLDYGMNESELLRSLTKGFKILDRMSGLFAISKARILLYKGLFQFLSGRPRKSEFLWDSALSHARRIGMCYDEALILLEVGRHAPIASAKRAENLGMARDMFEQSGALAILDHVDSLLSKS